MAGFKKFQREAVAGAVFERSVSERMVFIKKVYTMLALGIGAAAFGGILTLNMLSLSSFISQSYILFMVLQFGLLIATIFLRKKNPVNQVLFYSFTFIFGLSLGPMLVSYQMGGVAYIIIQALALTTLAFGGLTAYAWTTKKDFTMLGGLVWSGFGILIGMIILNLFLSSSIFALLIPAVGVLLFSFFILYDTQNVMRVYQEDEYVSAALALFLDFANLFLYIVQLLTASRD